MDESNKFINILIISITRSILAIPLHCICGALIGINKKNKKGIKYGRRKFLNEKLNIFYILYLSVLIHGFYDFLLLFFSDFKNFEFLGVVFSSIWVIVSFSFVLFSYFQLKKGWMLLLSHNSNIIDNDIHLDNDIVHSENDVIHNTENFNDNNSNNVNLNLD
jgi:hypothetical protein